MHCFYLDASNEQGSEVILSELDVVVNDRAGDSNCEELQLTSSRLDDVYKEKKSVYNGITYESSDKGFCIDVRDTADCWLRICLSPRQCVSLPKGLYHRLYTDSNQSVPVFVRTLDGKPVEIEQRFPNSNDSGYSVPAPHRFRELTCELCRQFFECGWVTGTGGSISIRYGNRIFMTPSGVQKERILPDEVFLLDISGKVLCFPPQKIPNKIPKLTDCSPLFFHAYRLRNAGAVIHSHDITCVLASALFPNNSEYRISRQEMIKGIAGHGYLDELVVPIIENTPRESELADSLEEAILNYPKSSAVLVRDHGIYVWGDSWEAAKRHSECLHYLFNVSIQMNQVGIQQVNPSCASYRSLETTDLNVRKRKADVISLVENNSYNCYSTNNVKCVLLDIEGTTTPITFVKDVLFPYSSKHLNSYLTKTWQTKQTQEIVSDLVKQQKADGADVKGVVTNVTQVVEYAISLIEADRKVSPLKKLQGLIWKQGYANGDLQAVVYDDVPVFLERMRDKGKHSCIYSSGSRGAQQLLFKHTNFGDLRHMLHAYFDTSVGQKNNTQSYADIILTLGYPDKPSEILFVTDIIGEAIAAKDAGMQAVISVRPGNAKLPMNHGFPVINSFDLLQDD